MAILLLAVGFGGLLSYYYRNEVAWFYDKLREGARTYSMYYSTPKPSRRREVERSRSIGRLSYSHNGEEYEIVFPLRRGPSTISSAWTVDNEGNKITITDELLRFAGLSKNFHGISTTPFMLGWENGVWYEKLNNETIYFGKNEAIQLL